MELKYFEFAKHGDARGELVAIEQLKDIPFDIKRIYTVFNTEPGVRRGFHAHLTLQQVAIVVSGECKFLFDDGRTKKNITLDDPGIGVLIEPMVWHEMYDFSDDCVLLVIANDVYDETDYIRNYDKFIKLVKGN